MSPLSDELPSAVEEEESEGEDEAINEKEKKTKILERIITTQYNASKCVVLFFVCSTNTPRFVAPPIQLAHALQEVVAAHQVHEHEAQHVPHELFVPHVQHLQIQLYVNSSLLPHLETLDASYSFAAPAANSSVTSLLTAEVPRPADDDAPNPPRRPPADTPSPRIDSPRESRECTAADTPRRFAGRSRTSHWGTALSPLYCPDSRGFGESHRSFPRKCDRGFRGFFRDSNKSAAGIGREEFEAKSTRTLR